MSKNSRKNAWSLLLLMLAGVVLGSFIGWLAKDAANLSWLNYGQEFGFDKPFHLDLGILKITFGLTVRFTVGSILGIILAIFVYKKI